MTYKIKYLIGSCLLYVALIFVCVEDMTKADNTTSTVTVGNSTQLIALGNLTISPAAVNITTSNTTVVFSSRGTELVRFDEHGKVANVPSIWAAREALEQMLVVIKEANGQQYNQALVNQSMIHKLADQLQAAYDTMARQQALLWEQQALLRQMNQQAKDNEAEILKYLKTHL